MRFYEITESLDKPYPINMLRLDDGDWYGDAMLDDGGRLEITIEKKLRQQRIRYKDNDGRTKFKKIEPKYELQFVRNGTDEVTGDGNSFRIFATIKSAVEQFVTQEKFSVFSFAAKTDDGTGRINLYRRFAKMLARKLRFRLVEQKVDDYIEFVLSEPLK